jgi:hypothetical protein
MLDLRTVFLAAAKSTHGFHAAPMRGISYIFEKKIHAARARAARPRGFESLPSLSDVGTVSFR